MVLSFKTGNWTSRATTGTDTISGVGFQPKAIIIFSTSYYIAFDSIDASSYFGIGAAADITAANQRTIFSFSEDADTPNTVTKQAWNSAASCNSGTGDGYNTVGYVSAIGSDGFTFNWTTISRATKMEYICLGGTDLTSAKVGNLTTPATGTTGNQSYTGVGFQPDFILFFGNNAATSGAAVNGNTVGVGFAISSSSQMCWAGTSKHNTVGAVAKRYLRTDNTQCYSLVDDTTPTTLGLVGSLVSMDVDGFTINWTTVASAEANKKVNYLAIKGGSWKIGAITAPTAGVTPVSQATTGISFQPTGLMLLSACATASTSVQANYQIGIGAGSSSSDYRCGFCGDNDGASTVQTMNINKTSPAKIYTCYTVVGNEANSTVNAEAGLTSLDATGFTLSWTTRDTNAYQIIYAAVGNKSAQQNISRSITESVSASTAATVSRALAKQRPLPSEGVGAFESGQSPLYQKGKSRSTSETVTSSESLTMSSRHKTRTISQTVSITENMDYETHPKRSRKTITENTMLGGGGATLLSRVTHKSRTITE